MEDLFEILIPLIIGAVYFFGNVLSKKSDDELDEREPMSRQRDEGEDLEQAKRQHEVQEEIRRKIEARRQAAPQGPDPISRAEPARMVRERSKRTKEDIHETRLPKPVEVRQPEMVTTYDAAMQAQLAKIERTRKKAAALKAQSAAASKKSQAYQIKTTKVGSSSLREPVRSALNNPGAARSAFIYGEVLGTPVGLRKQITGAFEGIS
ncbi:MAG: Uncharacterised protein [Opitutia bacterium UBA7350]|nr:MAG: Uncharacterised protein [Opitutae bacterium UBA7350]